MTRTSVIINFGTYDALGYKQDSTVVLDDATAQSFSKISDLKYHKLANKYPYASFEPNFWLLDGSFKIKPASDTNIHVGLMTSVQSNSTGVFATRPRLTVTFPTARNTDGLQLFFDEVSGDWANGIEVAYFNASNGLIRDDYYYPTSAVFSVAQPVTAFKKIIINFISTNKPYRYLRLLDIDYSTATYFSGDEIKTALVIEEICPTSTELPYSILDLHLFTSDQQFSIIDPGGEYSLLQQRQPLYVYEKVDTTQLLIGKFFIDTWDNPAAKEVIIRALDTIGILGLTDWVGDWVGENVTDFLTNKLLTPIGVNWTLDSALASVVINGVLPVGTYRETIQQLCLAIGAFATCTRSGTVDIHVLELASTIVTPDFTFTAAEKAVAQPLRLRTLVTGVEVTSHDFTYSGVSKIVYGPVGWPVSSVFTIIFTEPIYNSNVTVTGATIVSSGVNFLELLVTSTPVTVTAEGLRDSTTEFGVYNTSLSANVLPNIIKITDAKLVKQSIQAVTAQRLYDYYQQRYQIKLRLFATTAHVGDSALVDTMNGRQIIGVIEKSATNLSGGFISDLEIIGIVKPL